MGLAQLTKLCCVGVAVAAVLGVAAARPNVDATQRDARGQTVLDSSDPMGRRHQPQPAVQTLAYYGGAKGQYLVIHPSGRRTVSRTPPPPRGHKPDNEDEDVGMAPDEEAEGEGDDESVAINPPPENASVAEAKPVGLAIAGPGGVASSKPVAQAIVGPGGLAVARPIATAIAGVKGAGLSGAVAAAGAGGPTHKQRPGAANHPQQQQQQQVFFDPQTNQLHATPVLGQRYLYPVNLYN